MLENKIWNYLLTNTTETIIGNLSESLITERKLYIVPADSPPFYQCCR